MAWASHVVTLICHARGKTNLAFCTNYEDETSADREKMKCTKRIQARRDSSEGFSNNLCEISAEAKFSKHSEKEAAFRFTMLAAEPSFSSSAPDLSMF